MNWLAHLFLSEDNVHHRLGNLLADTVKRPTWPGIHPHTEAGIALHHKIDSFTDNHALVKLSKSRLNKRGLLKGIAIDLVYDHFLIKHWDQYSRCEFHSYIDSFREEALVVSHLYPKSVRHFIRGILESNYLKTFETQEGIQRGFSKMENRLSPRIKERESMLEYLPLVEKSLPLLEEDFLEFFPKLSAYVDSLRKH